MTGGEAHSEESVPEKGAAAQHQPVPKKRAIIAFLKHVVGHICRGCRLKKLSRSSSYYKPKSQSPDRMEVEDDLRDRIEAVCLE